jgi:hypothetical protein
MSIDEVLWHLPVDVAFDDFQTDGKSHHYLLSSSKITLLRHSAALPANGMSHANMASHHLLRKIISPLYCFRLLQPSHHGREKFTGRPE